MSEEDPTPDTAASSISPKIEDVEDETPNVPSTKTDAEAVKEEYPSDTDEKNGDGNSEKKGEEEPTLPGKEELNQICLRVRSMGGGGGGNSNPQHAIAEFLYQLTKMLSDDNQEIIEWSDGRIKVHYPERLENELLAKYFRHAKYASFQRQLNYFGFRKIAGKGKMSPCSYVNDTTTNDIRSLLQIKRKTNGSAARKAIAASKLEEEKRRLEGGANADLLLAARRRLLLNSSLAQQLALTGGGASAGALLQENALRAAGLGAPQMFGGENPYLAGAGLGGRGAVLDDLARLASLRQQLRGGAAAGLGLQADQAAAAAAAAQAVNPATAAMNAALGSSGQENSESLEKWKSAIAKEEASEASSAAAAAAIAARQGALASSASAGRLSDQNLLHRQLLAQNLSNASLSQLLQGNNRASSLLSLSGLLSREPSVADLIANGFQSI